MHFHCSLIRVHTYNRCNLPSYPALQHVACWNLQSGVVHYQQLPSQLCRNGSTREPGKEGIKKENKTTTTNNNKTEKRFSGSSVFQEAEEWVCKGLPLGKVRSELGMTFGALPGEVSAGLTTAGGAGQTPLCVVPAFPSVLGQRGKSTARPWCMFQINSISSL